MRLRSVLVPLIAVVMAGSGAAEAQRSFMLRAGDDPVGAPQGMTQVHVVPGGAIIDFYVWFEDPVGAEPLGLNAYQLIFPWFATGGSAGTIEYLDLGQGNSDTIFVDWSNPDWLFSHNPLVADVFPSYNETPPGGANTPIFGVIQNTLLGQGALAGPNAMPTFPNYLVPNPGEPNYAAQFSVQVSQDACGTFVMPFNTPPGEAPFSAYFNPNGAAYRDFQDFDFQPVEIAVGPQNDQCVDATALDAAIVHVNFDTTCGTIDGSQVCAPGADIWFTYTMQVDADLDVSATVGDVVVYGPGATCETPGAGQCNPAIIPAAQAGQTFLIQVIGDDINGRLDINGCACLTDPDCNDANPCTDDVCAQCACSHIDNGTCLEADPVPVTSLQGTVSLVLLFMLAVAIHARRIRGDQ